MSSTDTKFYSTLGMRQSYLSYNPDTVWVWDVEKRRYISIPNNSYQLREYFIAQFLKTRVIDPEKYSPVLCCICRRLVYSARELAYNESRGKRVLQAWCSDECFNADPKEDQP